MDDRRELLFGSFITPTVAPADQAVQLAVAAERAGFDFATFADHPYNPARLDCWTLMSYIAARTDRIRLAPNVLNLPMRQPVVIARSAAGLDLLTGGRIELGLGAGAFWDAISAAGGPRLTPGEAVTALEEAIGIIRGVWATEERGGLREDGQFYRVAGAKRGPTPAHDIGIWLGAYKPRMLALTGRLGDGWIPSLGYLPGGPGDLAALNHQIDDAAAAAGRDPAAIRRLLNISGEFAPAGRSLLHGPPDRWALDLTEIVLECGISGFILASDDRLTMEQFADEVAPAVREMVAAERSASVSGDSTAAAAGGTAGVPGGRVEPGRPPHTESKSPTVSSATMLRPTPDNGVRLSTRVPWDETTRPLAPPPQAHRYTDDGEQAGQLLLDVHQHLRQELAQIRDLIEQVRDGAIGAGEARSAINQMTMRQNNWTLGAYCAAYCRVVTMHHGYEDSGVFPHLRRSDTGLRPVIDRLEQEHVVIHDVLDEVDRALVDFVARPTDFGPLSSAVDLMTDALLSHLSYEEGQILEPVARYGFYTGHV